MIQAAGLVTESPPITPVINLSTFAAGAALWFCIAATIAVIAFERRLRLEDD